MNKKTKYILLVSSFLVTCALLGSLVAFSSFKPTVTTSTTYPAYTIFELAKVADNIVYGEVREKGKTTIKKIPIVQGTNNITVTDNTYSIMPFSKKPTHTEAVDYSEDVYTNVDIQIKQPIKLNGLATSTNANLRQQSILPYKEEGGETDSIIYKSEDEEGTVSEGDEVIIFTNKAGYNWGPQSVLKVENGMVTDKDGTKYTIDELINVIQDNI